MRVPSHSHNTLFYPAQIPVLVLPRSFSEGLRKRSGGFVWERSAGLLGRAVVDGASLLVPGHGERVRATPFTMAGPYKEYSVHLHRDALSTPWGFRLQGGKDFKAPLTIQRVSEITLFNIDCSVESIATMAVTLRRGF